MSRLFRGCLAALALVLAFAPAGCAKKTAPEASTTNYTPPSATTPVTVAAVELGKSVGADKLVTERAEIFKPKDTIYASIRTNGASPSTRIGVKWSFEDGQVVDQSEQVIAPDGAATTEFHITKPDGFPTGTYKVEVMVDGSVVQTKDFRITAS